MGGSLTWNDPLAAPKSTEEIAKPHEHEYERTWLVDGPAFLEAMGEEMLEPWMLVQGYFEPANPADEISVRTIPARGLAFMRRKSKTYNGLRAKISTPLRYDDAVASLPDAEKGVALKMRHLVRDDFGRAWLVDYFPDGGVWVAETEYADEAEMKAHTQFPDWLGKEVTGNDEGYTRNRARPRTARALQKAIEVACDCGSRDMYCPSEESGFQWVMDTGRWNASG